MSNYDPFQLYTNKQKKTHQGQVIRKKIPNYIGYCFTNEELDRAIEGLKARGYHIYEPGVNPERQFLKHLEHTYIYPNIDLGNLQYANQTQYTYNFSDIWPLVINDYSDILSIDNLRVQQCHFFVSLISYSFGGMIAFTGNSGIVSFSIYYDPTSVFPDESFGASTATTQWAFGASSFSDQYALKTQTRLIKSQKVVATNIPYLNITERQQVAILTALRTEDYNVFDPQLLKWESVINVGPTTFWDLINLV